MDQLGVGVVAEVQRAEVEEVEDEDQLGPAEIGPHKEHDEGKVEKVVEDEVAAHAGGGVDVVGIAREETADVAGLEDEQENPVDVGNDKVHGEGGGVEVVLVPEPLADVVAVLGCVDIVVDRHDDGEKPGEQGQNLVDRDARGTVRFPLAEGVVYGMTESVDVLSPEQARQHSEGAAATITYTFAIQP